MNEPCPECGKNRWKTKKKNVRWECRNCGYTRYEPQISIDLTDIEWSEPDGNYGIQNP